MKLLILKVAFIISKLTLTCTVLSCPVYLHDDCIGADKPTSENKAVLHMHAGSI